MTTRMTALAAEFDLLAFSLAVFAAVLAPLAVLVDGAAAGRMRTLVGVSHRNLLPGAYAWRKGTTRKKAASARLVPPAKRPVLAVPRRALARKVGECAARVERHAEGSPPEPVGGALFHPFDEVSIERVFPDHQRESADWSDDMIDPAAGARFHADVADGRLAQRTELELDAIDHAPYRGAAA